MKLVKTLTLLSLIAFLLALSAPNGIAETKKKKSDENVATVNGTPIPKTDFDGELEQYQNRMASQGNKLEGEKLEKVKKSIMDNLINTELLFQQSQKKGITVEQTAVDERIEALKKRYPTQEEFDKSLEEMNLTPKELTARIKKGMAIQNLLETEVIDKVAVPDEKIKEFYDSNPQYFEQPEQIKASHILIKVEEGADEKQKAEAKKKIQEIQKKVKKGDDFAELAKNNSEGPSKDKGGDLGYFGRGQMVKPFEDAAFALKPNEVSDIVETRFGYHIIKVTEKKPAGQIEFKDAKAKITGFLKKQETQKEVNNYIEKLKKEAKIEILL